MYRHCSFRSVRLLRVDIPICAVDALFRAINKLFPGAHIYTSICSLMVGSASLLCHWYICAISTLKFDSTLLWIVHANCIIRSGVGSISTLDPKRHHKSECMHSRTYFIVSIWLALADNIPMSATTTSWKSILLKPRLPNNITLQYPQYSSGLSTDTAREELLSGD